MANSLSEYPIPPGMTQSNWPIAHGSTWNSDVSALAGPSKSDNAVQLLINGDNIRDTADIILTADSITIAQSSVDGYMWGSGVSGVYQLKLEEGGELSVINTYFRDVNFEFHGAYSLIAADGTYYAAARSSIQSYHNEVPMDFTTPIVMTGEWFVPNLIDGEHIIGLTMTYGPTADKAFLVYATTRGQVGAVSLDFSTPSANMHQIPGLDAVELPDHFVSNSIALDGPAGGIYVVTSRALSKLHWDFDTLTISEDWLTDYGNGHDEWFFGRLGPGAGASPTIVGPNGFAEFCVISDGETPMNVRFYNATTGVEVGKHVVHFGGATGGNTTTEQSIVVLGYKAVLSNNWVADIVTPFCAEWFASTNASDALKKECPFIFGQAVPGLEQFEIDPATGTVVSTWANPDISCSSTIPLVSAATNTLYCLGKRDRHGVAEGRRAVFTIEAIDWETGASLYHFEISSSLLANGLYAGTIVGTGNDVVMGTLGGIVRVSPPPPPPAAPSSLAPSVDQHDVGQSEAQRSAASFSLDERDADLLKRLHLPPLTPSVAAVWEAMQQLADWNSEGHIPIPAELSAIGLVI